MLTKAKYQEVMDYLVSECGFEPFEAHERIVEAYEKVPDNLKVYKTYLLNEGYTEEEADKLVDKLEADEFIDFDTALEEIV